MRRQAQLIGRRGCQYCTASASAHSTKKEVGVDSFVVDDYYQRLGIVPDASTFQIKAAYRQRALQCHPDLSPEGIRGVYEKAFRAVTEAYQCLCNATERKRYDSKRRKRSVPRSTPTAESSTTTHQPKPSTTTDDSEPSSSKMSAADVNEHTTHAESPWTRYNRYKYFHVFYTKDKTAGSAPTSQTEGKHVHIRMTKSRSETIFRRAFFGRRVEHVILDMHHALNKGTFGTVSSMYGVDVRELRQEIREAILHFRAQEKQSKTSERSTHEPFTVPSPRVGRKLSFIPPYNIPLPQGTIIPTIAPTRYAHPDSLVGQDVGGEIVSATSVVDHTTHIVPSSGILTAKNLLRSRYMLTEGGIFPHYEDPRDYRAECTRAKLRANWTTGQGMLYSYHRPF